MYRTMVEKTKQNIYLAYIVVQLMKSGQVMFCMRDCLQPRDGNPKKDTFYTNAPPLGLQCIAIFPTNAQRDGH